TGISAGYSGAVHKANVASWTMNASGGIGSLGTSNFLSSSSYIYFTSGQITYWQIQAGQNSAFASPVITTIDGSYEEAYAGYPPTYPPPLYGYSQPYPIEGIWTNPKALGPSLPPPQVADGTPTTDPPRKPDCPTHTCPGDKQVGDPIDVSTGNVYQQVTDYTTVGQNPLSFVRYYNSMAVADTLATGLGRNWRHNYDRYLRVISGTEIDVERATGQVVSFVLVSGAWTHDTDVDMTLTNSGATYTLTDHDDTIETYTVSGSVGTLNSIALPNGYTQTMNYTSGVLTSVSDSYSRSLSFTYTSGLLTGVSTPDSATLTYGYTTTDGKPLLTSVTYNTSPSTSQTYSYTNTSYPFALTGITDENGNSYASWSYDNWGRATMSEHAGGADEVQVSYNDSNGQRTVTNP